VVAESFYKVAWLELSHAYKKGSDNTTADALSRRDAAEPLMAVSSSSPQWLSVVVSSYADSSKAQKLLTQLVVNPASLPHFSLLNGVIRCKGRIWLGHSAPLQSQVLQALHSSPLGGHSGVPVTYQKLRQLFFSPGMLAATTDYIRACDICQRAKPDHSHSPGLL
jgi:hypothetical protein